MASPLAILSFLQLVALVFCIATADVKSSPDDKNIDAVNDAEDLETQETGWLIQEKMRQLEYFKNKLFSPFLGLKSPYTSYAGGYPGYSNNGGNKFSSSFSYRRPSYYYTGGSSNYPSSFGGFGTIQNQPNSYSFYPYKKPPTFTSNVWYNKGFSGGVSQPSVSSYSPDCDYSTGFKPSFYTPSRPSYSSGTPLFQYYSSTDGPTQTNSPQSSISSITSSQGGSVAPEPSPVPDYTSLGFAFKTYSPQYSSDSTQSSGPSSWGAGFSSVPSASVPPSWSSISESVPSSWSSVPASFPGFPSSLNPAPPTWSSISGTVPSAPTPSSGSFVPASFPAAQYPSSSPAPPTWSSVSTSVPASPSFSSTPSSSYWSSITSSTPSPPSWSSVTPSPHSWPTVIASVPSLPASQDYSTPAPPSIVTDSGPLISTPSPVSIAQPLYGLSSISSAQNSVPSVEVPITPPPPVIKGHFVTTLPGPKVPLPEGSSQYNPGSPYAVSYYPNLFIISNEQHLDSPSLSEVSSQGQVVSTPTSTNSLATDKDAAAPETSTSSSKSSTISKQVPPQPALTTFYSSNTIEQTRIPIAYSIQQPISPPSNGVFYNYPLVPNAYPTALGYFPAQNAQQGVQIPSNTIPSVNTYPIPVGYGYREQSQVQAVPPTKTSLPGC